MRKKIYADSALWGVLAAERRSVTVFKGMKDAASARIARAQIWQWNRRGKAVFRLVGVCKVIA
jgi:malate synthase